MNAAKTTLVSTVVAMAFGLMLALTSTPAQAHCPHKGDVNHEHCDGGSRYKFVPDKDLRTLHTLSASLGTLGGRKKTPAEAGL